MRCTFEESVVGFETQKATGAVGAGDFAASFLEGFQDEHFLLLFDRRAGRGFWRSNGKGVTPTLLPEKGPTLLSSLSFFR